MSALSDYLENELLDHLLRNSAAPQANTLYLALFTADPGESGNTGEVSGNAYARVAITNNLTNFPACAVTGTPTKTNGAAITFPTATPAGWGTVTHWAIYDDDGDPVGNMLVKGAFSTPRTVNAGDTPRVAAGALSITAANASGGGVTTYAQRKLLDHVFGKLTFTPPAAVYLGVGTALSGETITEWSDANYARQATGFDAASGGVCVNSDAEVPNANVDTGGVTLTHWGLWDDLTSGNLLAVGLLGASRTPGVADSTTFGDSALSIELQ